MTYRLVVFDWDGTLMDSAADIVYCFQAATQDLQWPVPSSEEIHNIIGLGMKEAVAILFPHTQHSAKDVDALVERYRYYYFHPEKRQPVLFAGASELVRQLEHEGYFLAVATGKGRQGLNGVLERTGLKDAFHITRCVDEAHSKPHPQMLEDIMAFVGVEPGETLMVGDSEYDLLMANNAGVDAAAVLCGAHSKDRLLTHNPVIWFEHTYQLGSWLKTQNIKQ
ncbi:MAG: HAD-IA family hydrolase [Gammaproteobacteria bacterium]|nr:HAD-IA family hydrolase [Gammaproteobacteria bacterium]